MKQRPPTLWTSTMGFVYFAQAGEGGPIKIGWAQDPRKRLLDLQTALWVDLRLLKAVRGTRQDEAALHLRLGSYGIQREWFYPTIGMLEFIAMLEDEPIPDRRKAHIRHKNPALA